MSVGTTTNNGSYYTSGNYDISGSGSFTTPAPYASSNGTIPATVSYIS